MLTPKKVRMLQLLDKQISNCNKCSLHKNGTSVPYYGPYAKYIIIGESPGYNDIRTRTPFNGAVGSILTTELSKVKFKASDFLIINTVQCRTISAKPNDNQILACRDYIRKYIKIVDPEKILCLGNYAKSIFTKNTMGVLRERGKFQTYSFGDGKEYPVLFTINPAYCIYNQEDGLSMLKEDILLFKNTKFERRSNWLLSEEDFLI